MSMILPTVLLIAFNAMAFWQGPKPQGFFLYFLMVPIDIVYGLYLAADSTLYTSAWVMGVITAIMGLFFVFKSMAIILNREN